MAAPVTPVPDPKLAKPPNKRTRTPTVLQMEAVECGAAALGIVLAHYGRFVPLEELRLQCGVSRDGSKANNVMKAARHYGLEAKGFKQGLEALYTQNYPCILFWNFNHFLVLEGFKGERVFLNDPASGPRAIAMEELDASFSGVLLTFKPGPNFQKAGAPNDIIAALRKRLVGHEKALMFAVLCGLLLVVPGLIAPTFSRLFIDEYLVGNRTDLIGPLLTAMGLSIAFTATLTWLQERALLKLETKISLLNSASFFNHILRLPVSYFAQRFAGEIGSRISLNDNIASLITARLATIAIDMVLIVFYAILLMLYDFWLTLLCMTLATINIVATKYVSRFRVDASRRLSQEGGKLTGTAMGGLRMIETIKATGAEAEFFARWSGYQAKALKSEQDLGRINGYMAAVPPFVTALITCSILMIGGFKVMSGAMTVGMLIAYQVLMASFTRPLNNFVRFGGSLQELDADMNRLDDVLKNPQDSLYDKTRVTDPRAANMIKLSGEIELRNISFGWSPLEPALVEDFSLHIKPGQRVALVGGSGSGKSTVAKLITGLLEPWTGDILFDGISRKNLPGSLISNSLGVVDQDIFLFQGTVRENLTMWDSTALDVYVMQAARDAVIAETVETRDGAYQSMVEEGGGNFSGGQSQRLEIARALISNPTMLVLDEATSALDTATERIIDDNLRRRGCTCITVAHRLSTIRDSDEIIVMERGKIVQRGTHDQLKAQPGLYQELIKE